MIRVLELCGVQVTELELLEFSVDSILEHRDEALADYAPENGDNPKTIEVRDGDVEFVTIMLVDSDGETTFYVGKRDEFTVSLMVTLPR